jgi:hypothetical protein
LKSTRVDLDAGSSRLFTTIRPQLSLATNVEHLTVTIFGDGDKHPGVHNLVWNCPSIWIKLRTLVLEIQCYSHEDAKMKKMFAELEKKIGRDANDKINPERGSYWM